MPTCRPLRSLTAVGIVLAAMLAISFEQAEAVPLSRYGRANLARYGKRSGGGRPGPTFVIDDANPKGICKYTGVGELYWCQFVNSQTSDDADDVGL